jgi:hypothetical protein
MFGHTDFIDNPLLNKKDRYRVARSLGFRSLLEYSVAKKLREQGIEYTYEQIKIQYFKPDMTKENFEVFSEWLENNPNVKLEFDTVSKAALKKK